MLLMIVVRVMHARSALATPVLLVEANEQVGESIRTLIAVCMLCTRTMLLVLIRVSMILVGASIVATSAVAVAAIVAHPSIPELGWIETSVATIVIERLGLLRLMLLLVLVLVMVAGAVDGVLLRVLKTVPITSISVLWAVSMTGVLFILMALILTRVPLIGNIGIKQFVTAIPIVGTAISPRVLPILIPKRPIFIMYHRARQR